MVKVSNPMVWGAMDGKRGSSLKLHILDTHRIDSHEQKTIIGLKSLPSFSIIVTV